MPDAREPCDRLDPLSLRKSFGPFWPEPPTVEKSLAHRNRGDFSDLRLRCTSRTSEIASNFRDFALGGVFDPAASSRPPPAQRSHSIPYVGDIVRKVGLFLFGWFLLGCVPLCMRCCLEAYWPSGPAKSRVYIFLGSQFLFGMLLVLAPPGAVPVVGGFSDPSVPWSPGVSPQRVQGGPWAPPPCGVKSSETCWFCVCLFVRFFLGWMLVILFGVLSLGLE